MIQHKKINISFSSKRTLEQYQKLLLRLRQSLKKGRFQQFSKIRQRQLISSLNKYLKKLTKKIVPSKKLVTGSALLLALLSTYQSKADYVQLGGFDNPLGFVDVGNFSYPAFVDVDQDGDQDAFVGNSSGQITYFENTGTTTNPVFVEVTGTQNPFDGVFVGTSTTPVFADLDGDADQDAFFGNSDGTITYFINSNGNFTQVTGAANPFDGEDIGANSAPNFIDIDNDGDLDAFVGGNNGLDGELTFYRNDGTVNVPNFTKFNFTDANNPFNGQPLGANPLVTFVDYDQDNDFDAFVGSNLGIIQYYENTGDNTQPTFTLVSGEGNPFNGIDVGRNAALIPNPCFIDIDGDGDKDVFIGNSDGTLNFFEHRKGLICDDLGYFKTSTADNPVGNQDVGNYSDPDLIDFDQDGDLDLFVADSLGQVTFFRNDGSSTDPIFTPITGTDNPFDGIDIGSIATIDLVDIDQDGDADAFLGNQDGIIQFYQNDGAGNFSPVSGSANPFDGIDVGTQSSPTFADIDQDGDLDAFVGNKDGQLLFFRNDGSPTAPNFVQITDANNPFFGIDLEGKFVPEFADIDQDGDLDAIIGNKTGNLLFFRNDGTATTPNFVGLHGACNPFEGLLPVLNTDQEFSAPVLADIDGDGVLEILVGQFGGEFCYLDREPPQRVENEQPIPTLSEWGLISIALLLMSFGTILISRKEELLALNAIHQNNRSFNVNQDYTLLLRKPPIDGSTYLKALVFTGLLSLIAALATFFVYQTIAWVDVFGTLTAGPIFAYLLHLILPKE